MKKNRIRKAPYFTLHRIRNDWGKVIFSLFICLSILIGIAPQVGQVQAKTSEPALVFQERATYTYTNSVSYNIPDGTSLTQNGCTYWPATRYFLVNDNFTVNDLNVVFTQAHATRGEIKVILKSPAGTTRTIIATNAGANDNYDIRLDGDSGGALNDGNNDTTATPIDRTVLQPLLTNFEGENAEGTWAMTICDNVYTGGNLPNYLFVRHWSLMAHRLCLYPYNTSRALQKGKLILSHGLKTMFGPPWGASSRTSCSTYATFRDYYDAAPRQPMVGFTSITMTEDDTVITYDHWEDGYETAVEFPVQNTTKVWGDGDLLNGVAPGDADDILEAGQIVVLNDAMLSTTLGTIIDYDARDKVTASLPIAISRSVWADGSQTLFAAADEVYSVSRWGTQFYAPVGDNADLIRDV